MVKAIKIKWDVSVIKSMEDLTVYAPTQFFHIFTVIISTSVEETKHSHLFLERKEELKLSQCSYGKNVIGF